MLAPHEYHPHTVVFVYRSVTHGDGRWDPRQQLAPALRRPHPLTDVTSSTNTGAPVTPLSFSRRMASRRDVLASILNTGVDAMSDATGTDVRAEQAATTCDIC